MDTPGGTEILARGHGDGPDRGGHQPVVGSPVYLTLTGRDGDTTRAAAAGDRAPGHYTVRIDGPRGGAESVEVGIRGTMDLPLIIMNYTIVPGRSAPGRRRLAPPIAAPRRRAARGVGRRPRRSRHSCRRSIPPRTGRRRSAAPRGARDRRARRRPGVALVARDALGGPPRRGPRTAWPTSRAAGPRRPRPCTPRSPDRAADPSETALVERARHGDAAAFGELVTHAPGRRVPGRVLLPPRPPTPRTRPRRPS